VETEVGPDRRRFIIHHGPAILWAAGIFILSSIPSLTIPDIGLNWQDKLGHVLEYGIFAVLLMRSFRARNFSVKKTVWLTLITGIAYGALDEAHQAFVPGRVPDMLDFVADACGMFLGIGVLNIVESLRKSGKK
jgi:hypothetical protein